MRGRIICRRGLHGNYRQRPWAMPAVALLVTEVNAPAGVAPLCWLLLTTMAVPDGATA